MKKLSNLFDGMNKKQTEERNSRKPIKIGEVYLFDPMGETNVSAATTAVTVLKKGIYDSTYIVISVNNGDVFECGEELLCPFVNYNTIKPIIRCQYGTTDFTSEDYMFYEYIMSKLINNLEDVIKETDDIPKESCEKIYTDIVTKYKILGDKIKKFASISNYKKYIEIIKTTKLPTEEELTLSKKNFDRTLEKSEFIDKFNELVASYNPIPEDGKEGINLVDFIDKALDLLEDVFPLSALVPAEEEFKYVYKEDYSNLINQCITALNDDKIVFLVGATSDATQIALAVYDICDIDQVGIYIENCYDKWEDKETPYKTEYRIVLITVDKNSRDIDSSDSE